MQGIDAASGNAGLASSGVVGAIQGKLREPLCLHIACWSLNIQALVPVVVVHGCAWMHGFMAHCDRYSFCWLVKSHATDRT